MTALSSSGQGMAERTASFHPEAGIVPSVLLYILPKPDLYP